MLILLPPPNIHEPPRLSSERALSIVPVSAAAARDEMAVERKVAITVGL
jgi:hypothetical protein